MTYSRPPNHDRNNSLDNSEDGGEVYLFLRLTGHPLDWSLALCLDAQTVPVAALGFMIPISAGVQDVGTILLSLGFNLGAPTGAAFSLARRLREAFWLALGLLVTARERRCRKTRIELLLNFG